MDTAGQTELPASKGGKSANTAIDRQPPLIHSPRSQSTESRLQKPQMIEDAGHPRPGKGFRWVDSAGAA
jgi:hypothetical protein